MTVTVNARLLDESIAHGLYLSRYSAGIAKKMVRLLNDSDKELSARLLVALSSQALISNISSLKLTGRWYRLAIKRYCLPLKPRRSRVII